MKPTGPIPPHFSASDDGQLMIGGNAVEELVAEAGGTPLFVYDNNIIGGQIAALRAAMPDGLALYYAVSANPHEELLNFVGRYVDGFRVVSRGELEHLKRAGLAGIGTTFAGPGKRDDELEAGIAAGATISLESEGEAARAIQAAERVGIQPRLAVRVNPPFTIEQGKVSLGAKATPFGVDAERVPSLVEGLLEADVDWRGLHIFAAAQCLDDDALIDAHKDRSPAARTEPGRRFRCALLRGRAADRRLSDGDRAARDGPRRTGAACDHQAVARTRALASCGVRRVPDPGPRSHGKLRPDLPHDRRRRASSARRNGLPAGTGAGQLPDRGCESLRRARGGGGYGHWLPRNPARSVWRRGPVATRRPWGPHRNLLRGRLRSHREPPGLGEQAPRARGSGLRVDPLHEIQSVRRRIEAQRGAIARFERLAHVFGFPLATAHERETTDH